MSDADAEMTRLLEEHQRTQRRINVAVVGEIHQDHTVTKVSNGLVTLTRYSPGTTPRTVTERISNVLSVTEGS